jgi:hypothetical protein
MDEGDWKIKVEITATKACFTGGPGLFDCIDDIMFVPLHAPFRKDKESDSLQIDIVENMSDDWPHNNRYFEVDLTQWSDQRTRNWICRKILKKMLP